MPALDHADYTTADFEFRWHHCNPLRKIARTIANVFRHPFHSARLRRHIPRTVTICEPDLVVSGVAIPTDQSCRILKRMMECRVRHMLVVGCGDGAALGEWFRLQPVETLGIDLYSFRRAWRQIEEAAECRGYWVRFEQMDIVDLAGSVPDGWADIIVSEAVFEHCRDLERAIQVLRRTLRPGGVLFASYGPLWHTAGGDHFSERGGLNCAYNHLLLGPNDFKSYFQVNLKQNEAVQDGGRYVPLNLFSRLTSQEYLDIYSRLGFQRERLIVELSPIGLEFRRRFPDLWARLIEMHPHLSPEEFLIKSHWVWLRHR